VGLGGYIYKQTTDDTLNGNSVANNRGRAFALGPSVKYDSGKGWFVTAKFQQKFNVVNGVEGQAFWLKAAMLSKRRKNSSYGFARTSLRQ
jgi:hypothetical protein